jgi:hypothetical protein
MSEVSNAGGKDAFGIHIRYVYICALLSFLVSLSLWGRENSAISSTGTAQKGVCVV